MAEWEECLVQVLIHFLISFKEAEWETRDKEILVVKMEMFFRASHFDHF